MRADAPCFVPPSPLLVPSQIRSGGGDASADRRTHDAEAGRNTRRNNGAQVAGSSSSNRSNREGKGPAGAAVAVAAAVGKDRRKASRRRRNRNGKGAGGGRRRRRRNRREAASVGGDPDDADADAGRKTGKGRARPKQRGKKGRGRSRSRSSKGKRERDENIGETEERQVLGSEIHFPSLNGNMMSSLKHEVVKNSYSSNWSQISAPPTKREDDEEDEGDEMVQIIKSKDLIRLSSSRSVGPVRRGKSAEFAAWSDGDDDGVGIADETGGAMESLEQTRTSFSEPAASTRLRGDMSRLRERWWTALREKKAKEREEREARMMSATLSSDSSSSSCSSVSSWASSSPSSLGYPADSNIAAMNRTSIPKLGDDARATHASKYLDMPYPLHAAVAKDDALAVSHLLALPPNKTQRDVLAENLADVTIGPVHSNEEGLISSFSLIHLATYLDKPHLLRIILDKGIASSALSVDARDESGQTPLMVACQAGFESCVRVLLSFGPRLMLKELIRGDTVLHICCRGGEASTLKLIIGASGRGSSQRRLLCARNQLGQTPMHVACAGGRTDLVEAFLSAAPSTATKALRIEDSEGRQPLLAAVASGATEVVMALLMWRGNNTRQGKHTSGRMNTSESMPFTSVSTTENMNCPLTEAVSLGSFEMVRLLLEFGGPSVSASSVKFDVTGALIVALSLQPDTLERSEIIALLVEAGADPYSCPDESSSRDNLSAISVAAHKGDFDALDTMLRVSEQVLESRRTGRRQDLLLQKHYIVIESRETSAIDASLQDTLVRSLFLGWKDNSGTGECRDSSRLRSCLSLYKHGAMLSDRSFYRLQKSLAAGAQHPHSTKDVPKNDVCFEAHYSHPIRVDPAGNADKSYWSSRLVSLGWLFDNVTSDSDLYCPWMKEAWLENKPHTADINSDFGGDDVCVVVVGSERIIVDKTILSNKSSKLEAALSFALLNRNDDDGDDLIELEIDAPIHLTKLFLQHCYHGSIVAGLPLNPGQRCDLLLELALFADFYLCPSLTLEVELRLLSSKPDSCFCVHCCKAVSPTAGDPAIAAGGESPTSLNFLCRVQGKSHLITTKTAVDILAMGRDASISSARYEVRAFAVSTSSDSCSLPPFGSVSLVAARSVLQDFEAVKRSEAFVTQLHHASACEVGLDTETLSLLLLETCLDAASTRPASDISSLEFEGIEANLHKKAGGRRDK